MKEKMLYKKDNCFVYTYNITSDGLVIFYSPSLAERQNGNGWSKAKMNQFIPEEFFNSEQYHFISKSEKNKIKSRLKMIYVRTGGLIHENCEEIIKHEKENIDNELKEVKNI